VIFLLIDNKMKFEVTHLNNKELLDVVNTLAEHDIKIVRYN